MLSDRHMKISIPGRIQYFCAILFYIKNKSVCFLPYFIYSGQHQLKKRKGVPAPSLFIILAQSIIAPRLRNLALSWPERSALLRLIPRTLVSSI